MNVFHRLGNAFDALRGAEQRSVALPGVSAALGQFPAPSFTGSTRVVSPATTEQLSTGLSCVTAISTAMAALPVYVYRRRNGGKDELPNHPLMRLVRDGVNQHQTWPDFVEWLVAQELLRGNGLAGVMTDRSGNVVELEPVPWDWCAVQMLPNGRLAYDVSTFNQIAGGNGRVKRWLEGEVLHFRDRTDDGVIGRSRIQRAAASVANALYTQNYASSLYENGAKPSGILTTDAILKDDQRARVKENFREMAQGEKGGLFVLEAGFKYEQLSISPEDAELLASRRFTTEDIARIFNVPPPIVGIWDNSTFTNSETAGRWFAQFTLLPIKTKLQAEMARSLLTEEERQDTEIVFDLSGLLQGNDEARWKNWDIAVKGKILTPNEVREQEGWNRRDGGDTFEAANATD